MITMEETPDAVHDSPSLFESPNSLGLLISQHTQRTQDAAKAKLDVLKFFLYLYHWIHYGKAILMKQDDSYYAEVRVDDGRVNAQFHDLLYTIEELEGLIPITIMGFDYSFDESLCILRVDLTRREFQLHLDRRTKGEAKCV